LTTVGGIGRREPKSPRGGKGGLACMEKKGKETVYRKRPEITKRRGRRNGKRAKNQGPEGNGEQAKQGGEKTRGRRGGCSEEKGKKTQTINWKRERAGQGRERVGLTRRKKTAQREEHGKKKGVTTVGGN